jgi:hypothetical protein
MTCWRWPGLAAMIFDRGLFLAFRDAADRYGKAGPVLEDALGGKLTYKRLLIGARALAARFAKMSDLARHWASCCPTPMP